MTYRLGRHGELLPVRGFSRLVATVLPERASAWRSHDGLRVISALTDSNLPGSGDPPQVGPQWLISVSLTLDRERRPTVEHVQRVVDGFAMPAFDIDNHHPGLAWHLWCPVDPAYRSACECHIKERTIVEADGYAWTTEDDDCRGCEYERLTGGRYPCPLHKPGASKN